MSESIPEWATDFDCWMRRAAAERKASQEAPKYWDDAAIELILSKINQKNWRQPFDRKALVRDLEATATRYAMWQFFDQRPTNKKARDQAERIRKLCADLRAALPDPDDLTKDGFAHLMFPTGDKVDVLRSGIANLAAIEKLTLIELAEWSKTKGAPNEWLINEEIPGVYERYFTTGPRGVSNTKHSKNPSGPAISFALAVLQVLNVKNYRGEPYKAAGIVEIWRRS
jgi:hypothetical protein